MALATKVCRRPCIVFGLRSITQVLLNWFVNMFRAARYVKEVKLSIYILLVCYSHLMSLQPYGVTLPWILWKVFLVWVASQWS